MNGGCQAETLKVLRGISQSCQRGLHPRVRKPRNPVCELIARMLRYVLCLVSWLERSYGLAYPRFAETASLVLVSSFYRFGQVAYLQGVSGTEVESNSLCMEPSLRSSSSSSPSSSSPVATSTSTSSWRWMLALVQYLIMLRRAQRTTTPSVVSPTSTSVTTSTRLCFSPLPCFCFLRLYIVDNVFCYSNVLDHVASHIAFVHLPELFAVLRARRRIGCQRRSSIEAATQNAQPMFRRPP